MEYSSNEIYKSYRRLADEIDWKKYSINDLFFEYIKHENDDLKEKFYSGIICRVFGYAGRVYRQVNRHIPFEQCYDIVIDAVNYVLEKRVWENPSSSLYKDKSAPDKAFHIALKRQRSLALALLTADKRQANFNNLSLDSFHEKYNDAGEGLLMLEDLTNSNNDSKISSFVSNYFDKGMYLEGFALDFICFNDSPEYEENRIVRMIKNLSSKQYNYYKVVYDLTKSEYNRYIGEINRTDKQLIRFHIRSLLHKLKEEYV